MNLLSDLTFKGTGGSVTMKCLGYRTPSAALGGSFPEHSRAGGERHKSRRWMINFSYPMQFN